jgi:hypothetical protein
MPRSPPTRRRGELTFCELIFKEVGFILEKLHAIHKDAAQQRRHDMSKVRFHRSLVLFLAVIPLLVVSAPPCRGSAGDPLPAGGTVTEIDATIETNLVLTSTGETFPLSVKSRPHAKCDVDNKTFDTKSGHWEMTNSFQTLQATFDGTPVGQVVISKNPKLPIIGVHTTTSDQPVFPLHSKVWLYLQIVAMGQTLVNRDPIILEADIDAWPQIGALYQATTGNIDFFSVDPDGDPTGSAVAQLFGTRVTVDAGSTVAPGGGTSVSTKTP